MKLLNPLHKLRGKAGFIRHSFREISRLVNDPKLSTTYFPESERKPKSSIWWDNLRWLSKYGEINYFYYVYGLDRKADSDGLEVLSYNEFRHIRDSRNQHPNREGYNYVCILRDKFIFSQFLTSLKFPTPANVALLNQKQVIWLDGMKAVPLESINADNQLNIDGFSKKLAGSLGEGAFPFRMRNDKLYIKEKEVTVEELKRRLTGQYLLQERVTQHPQMSALHPDSVNTIRLITFNNNGKVEPLCATQRIGTKGRNVDNWASGGIVVGIDLATGKLQKEGMFKPGYGGRVNKHPDTGITLEGFTIPFFKESVQLACNLHSYLYGIHSIGWDIAITPNGPTFIEGNDMWDGTIPMATEKNFKSRFLKMFEN